MKKSRKIIFRDFLSAAEFADFILNEPTRRGGELVDAANARKVAAIVRHLPGKGQIRQFTELYLRPGQFQASGAGGGEQL